MGRLLGIRCRKHRVAVVLLVLASSSSSALVRRAAPAAVPSGLLLLLLSHDVRVPLLPLLQCEPGVGVRPPGALLAPGLLLLLEVLLAGELALVPAGHPGGGDEAGTVKERVLLTW